MAVKVSPVNYPRLIQRLNQEHLICKRPMMGCLQHTMKGLLSANFYVNTWPDWTTLIGQIFAPRFSKTCDLVCYGNSTKELWQMMEQHHMLQDMKSHFFIGNDLHLKKSPQLPHLPYSPNLYAHYYLPNSARSNLEDFIRVPEGYFLQRLKKEHAGLIAKHWAYFLDLPNRISTIADFIQQFVSMGAFTVSDPVHPVSWTCVFHCGELAFGNTVKEHQMKGLFKSVTAAAAASLLDANMTPYVVVKIENEGVKRMCKNLGFVEDTVDNSLC